jgi:hypothetical protein
MNQDLRPDIEDDSVFDMITAADAGRKVAEAYIDSFRDKAVNDNIAEQSAQIALNCVDDISARMLNGGASKEWVSDYRLWFGVGYRVRLDEEYGTSEVLTDSVVAPERIAN